MGKNTMQLKQGIVLMLLASAGTCVGQLFWKLGNIHSAPLFFIGGFILYGCSSILMIAAFKFGELSVLHPMLSMGYILSLILGGLILKEPVSITKIFGIFLILIGMILLGNSGKDKRR